MIYVLAKPVSFIFQWCFPQNDEQEDQKGTPLRYPPPPSHAHFTCELSPSFIHANFSLSRRIYMRCCGAKVVSRFIWAEFIGSGFIDLFWFKCLWNAEGQKPGAHVDVRAKPIGFILAHLWLTQKCVLVVDPLAHAGPSAGTRQVSARRCSRASPSVLTQAAIIVL